MKRKCLAVIQAVLVALVILSGAIAVPILCRFFFYLHIEPLDLTDLVGLTAPQVKTAYKEMMQYCIGISPHFSAGALPFSQSGAAHFADVRKLFVLDLSVLVGSAVLLCGLLFFQKGRSANLLGHTPGFWGAVGLGSVFIVVGGLAALDFERAFAIFHQMFFPGKDNWLFDARYDPIILMLPAEFFRNCAILILAVILLSCGALVVYDRKMRRK